MEECCKGQEAYRVTFKLKFRNPRLNDSVGQVKSEIRKFKILNLANN